MSEQFIRLQNPVSHHYEAFITGNGLTCTRIPKHDTGDPQCVERVAELWDDGKDAALYRLGEILTAQMASGDYCHEVVQQNTHEGKTLVLCGAGPSLRDHAAKWVPRGDQVWAANSALTWLVREGYPVTYGVTVDQTAQMLVEWESAPDVGYLCASTIHPHLTEHLTSHSRRITWFHNYVGVNKPPVSYDGETMPFEDYLYSIMWPATIRCGSGLNTVTRAIDVALFMGFERIVVLGADCALRVKKRPPKGMVFGSPAHTEWLTNGLELHADGGNALASEATATTIQAEIDGRFWVTKPDMAISAVWLEQWRRKLGPKRLTLIGDTLPNAIYGKPESFMRRLPTLIDSEGNPLRFE